jgi:hypothetical protein
LEVDLKELLYPYHPAKLRPILNPIEEALATATVKSTDPDAFMDQAASDYVLAVRVRRAGSIIMTHVVRSR